MSDIFAALSRTDREDGFVRHAPDLDTDQVLAPDHVHGDLHARLSRSILINNVALTEVTAAPARRVDAASLANDLIAACALHGVPLTDVLNQFASGADGRIYTAFDRHPLTDQVCRFDATATEQQRLTDHDQSAFK